MSEITEALQQLQDQKKALIEGRKKEIEAAYVESMKEPAEIKKNSALMLDESKAGKSISVQIGKQKIEFSSKTPEQKSAISVLVMGMNNAAAELEAKAYKTKVRDLEALKSI